MPQCPRCGDVVDRLEPLPADALSIGARERAGSEGDPTAGRACRWCRHELLEG